MGHRVGAERADDVKMQVLVDTDNTAAAANGTNHAGSAGGDPRALDHNHNHHHHHNHRGTSSHQQQQHCEDDDDDQHHPRPPRRGTKRKLEEEEEQSQRRQQPQQQQLPLREGAATERLQSAVVAASPFSSSSCQEQAMDTSARESEETAAYATHRQSVFNLSVHKLSRFRHSPDPSLRRSVLICNTLRCLEREMVGEGVALAPDVLIFFPALQPADDLTLDPPPSPSLPLTPPSYERNLTDLDCPSGRVTPHPAGGEGSEPPAPSAAAHRQPAGARTCLPLAERREEAAAGGGVVADHLGGRSFSWSSVLNFSSQGADGLCQEEMWVCEGVEEDSYDGAASAAAGTCGGPGPSSGGPNTSPSSSSDSGISTASDEIFGDIDLSLYDFDLLPLSLPQPPQPPPSPSPPPSARNQYAASLRPPPLPAAVVAPSAEELLRSFPSVSPPASGSDQQQPRVEVQVVESQVTQELPD